MRHVFSAAALLVAGLVIGHPQAAKAQGYHYERGYTRQSGTYVPPHYQTNPDNSTANNWSTQGNTNPFTGQQGTRNPYPTYNSNPYQRTYP